MSNIHLNTYDPGDIIYRNKPFVYVLSKSFQSKICDYCLKKNSKVKRCSKCDYVCYCNKQCQTSAWQEHKHECKRLKYLPEKDAEVVRCAAKIILKLKTEEGEDCDVVGRHIRSFGSLISHKEDIIKDPLAQLHMKAIIKGLRLFLRSGDMPSDDDAIEIVGKVMHNCFQIHDGVNNYGLGLYLGASIFDHSCIPNASYYFEGTSMVIKAVEHISCDDITSVTITYFSVISEDIEEQAQKQFFAKCYCRECSLPYGQSVLTKILNKAEAFCVITLAIEHAKKLEYMTSLSVPVSIKEQVLAISSAMLLPQEMILGQTNIYKMKLLYRLMVHSTEKPQVAIKYGKQLATCIILAFGDKSRELVPIYNIMMKSYIALENIHEAYIHREKLNELQPYHGNEFLNNYDFVELVELSRSKVRDAFGANMDNIQGNFMDDLRLDEINTLDMLNMINFFNMVMQRGNL